MYIILDQVSPFPWLREKWNIKSFDGSIVAKIMPWDESGCRKEDVANCNLISAAPELYSSLKYIVDLLDNKCQPNDNTINSAKIALNKAEGI